MTTWDIQILTRNAAAPLTVAAESIFLTHNTDGSVEIWGHYPEDVERLIAAARSWEIITVQEAEHGREIEAAYATLQAELDPEPDAPTVPAPGLDRDGLTVTDLVANAAPLGVIDRGGCLWQRETVGNTRTWKAGSTHISSAYLITHYGPVRRTR